MKVIVERCKNASYIIKNKTFSSIEKGLLLLVAFEEGDNKEKILWMVNKIIHLRIFDENGKMTLSVKDVDGEILSIPQFTLYATLESGNRPSFARALAKPKASLLYQYFNEMLNKEIKTKTGVFGANMQISSINDGPVTIVIER